MLDRVTEWLKGEFAGNPRWIWAAALLLAAVTALALLVVRRVLRGRLEARAAADESRKNDALLALVRATYALFLLAVALYLGSLLLELGDRGSLVRRVIGVVALLQGGAWAVAVLGYVLARWRSRRAQDPSAATVLVGAGFIGRVVIWSVVVLLALDNLGVQVTTLVAGLGIGGIAVALAVQNVLGDLFASLSIVLDKPFEVGDFIIVGDLKGAVEYIGLKTTRVRSLSGEQIIFANSDLLTSRILNFKRMTERRVIFTIGVEYETPLEKVAAIAPMLKSIVEAQQGVRFDRSHFARYGDFALVFEVVYFVTTADFKTHMDIQQTIFLEIFRRFQAEGIGFAYPTQTLHVKQAPAG